MAGHSAVRRFGFNGLAIWRHQYRCHQAQGAKALCHGIGLDVTIIVFTGPDEFAAPLHRCGNHVTTGEKMSVEQLTQQVRAVVPKLDEISWASGQPLLLTEVGYKSTMTGLSQPWKWPSEAEQVDLELQAQAYRGVFQGFAQKSHFLGLFWWNWLSQPLPDQKFDVDFTPQGKPAQSVMKEFWGPQQN